MSSYNIVHDKSISSLIEQVDNIIVCIGEKDIMNRKLGIGSKTSEEDIDLISYVYDFLNSRSCNFNFDECLVEKISKLYNKFK